MPYVASSRASFGLRGGGSPRVIDVTWARGPEALGAPLRPVLSERLGRFAGEVEYAPAGTAHRCEQDERSRSVAKTESLLRASERVMGEIEALEGAKARVEADLLAAYGALHSIQALQVEALPRGGSAVRMAALVSPERVVAEEIALATGVGVGEVSRRLALATAPRRHRRVLAALRAGGTSLYRAVQVASETVRLSDADVAAVEEAVLAPSRDGRPVGQRTFTARLTRAVASVDARGAEERRAHAKARRGVFGRMVGDGMGCLTLTADAGTVAAILDRLDTQARAARGGGDPRTLDQLRCDLATHALLRDALITSNASPAYAGAPVTTKSVVAEIENEPVTMKSVVPEIENEPVAPPAPFSGDAAARVWLVVPFEVATGASDAACELPGHGWVTAAHARELMTRPGSVWQTLPVDFATGAAITRPGKAYRPTKTMVEHVQAVDGTCRGPDCQVPATRCDLDHETPWPQGETSARNLFAKHRLHHNVKTDGTWTSTQVAGDGLEWTTLTGRTYTTYPQNWREGLDPPPANGPPADPVPAQPDPSRSNAPDPARDADLPPF
ncbi:HNH endonuclease signature motif containing protein [Terrabacter sp. 2RAF25]|uniref:HNH endonuclease signature motif containing protein n=1 Tax=Terrabacter sp. 2RAF25 TaxID=3232998 RepID=UPI003F9CC7B1